jgi:hypothetical protein
LGDIGVDRIVVVKMNLKEKGCGGINWVYLAQDGDQ